VCILWRKNFLLEKLLVGCVIYLEWRQPLSLIFLVVVQALCKQTHSMMIRIKHLVAENVFQWNTRLVHSANL
jgi:hypothetical protein